MCALGSCLVCQSLNELDRLEWYKLTTSTEVLLYNTEYATVRELHADGNTTVPVKETYHAEVRASLRGSVRLLQ
jgi:hypothetical protein